MFAKQIKKVAKRSFEFQQDESDCGVAALSSIIQFHGGYVPLERLRAQSGTSTSGTTMLGLLQAGNQAGFITEAYEGTMEELKKLTSPTLLHILKYETIEHYVVCYQFDGVNFLVGDPEDGIKTIGYRELDSKLRSVLWFHTSRCAIK